MPGAGSAKRQQLVTKALELLKAAPVGLRYAELMRGVEAEFLAVPPKTIRGYLFDLDRQKPDVVDKPARGLFRHALYRELPPAVVIPKPLIEPNLETKVSESDFYRPFSEWLVRESEDCTKAIPLGGAKFRDRWGTPDVIGVKQPRASDIVKFTTEVVSAEIKLDPKELITAFGQACSYRLFSHKSYLVVPIASEKADIERLDALCSIFGIGLVLFDSNKPDDPAFQVQVRPTRHEPDMFYVNKVAKLIEAELF